MPPKSKSSKRKPVKAVPASGARRGNQPPAATSSPNTSAANATGSSSFDKGNAQAKAPGPADLTSPINAEFFGNLKASSFVQSLDSYRQYAELVCIVSLIIIKFYHQAQ